MPNDNQGFIEGAGSIWFLVFIFGILLLVIIILYTKKKANEAYEIFDQDKERLKILRASIFAESWLWPIYVRPVLFLGIDQEAQVYFSMVETALQRAEEIRTKIPALFNPPASNLFNILVIRKLIRTNIQIIRGVLDFSSQLDIAQENFVLLKDVHAEEERICNLVIQNVQEFGENVSTGIFAPKERGKEYEKQLNWVFNLVQNCLDGARQKLEKPTGDMLNFAVADTLRQLGMYVLNHMDLYERQQQVAARFLLDHFQKKLDKYQSILNQITTAASMDTWRELFFTVRLLDLAKRKLQKAIESYQDFIEKQTQFTSLESELLRINFSDLLKQAESLQVECAAYWKTRDEDATFWSRAIGSRPLPFSQVQDAYRSVRARITPETAQGIVIKQSSLAAINKEIRDILAMIRLANRDMRSLTGELVIHKNAEKAVWELIKPDGSLTRAVGQLRAIEGDSSTETMTNCIGCRQAFETYLNRARMVRGANFPQLQQEVEDLSAACLEVQQKHNAQVSELVNLTSAQATQIRSLLNTLSEMRQERPLIDWDWDNLINSLVSIYNQYNPNTRSFSRLAEYYSASTELAKSAIDDRDQITWRRTEYNNQRNNARNSLNDLQAYALDLRALLGESWVWERETLNEKYRLASRDYQEMEMKWQQVINLETLQQAKQECESIEDDARASLQGYIEVMKEYTARRQRYVENYQYLMASSVNGNFKLSSTRVERIKSFTQRAREASNETEVQANLDIANQLLRTSISDEEIEQQVADLSKKFEETMQYQAQTRGDTNLGSSSNNGRSPYRPR